MDKEYFKVYVLDIPKRHPYENVIYYGDIIPLDKKWWDESKKINIEIAREAVFCPLYENAIKYLEKINSMIVSAHQWEMQAVEGRYLTGYIFVSTVTGEILKYSAAIQQGAAMLGAKFLGDYHDAEKEEYDALPELD